MTFARLPPAELLARFDVAPVSFVEETAIANIWRVQRADGQPAALKVYKGAHLSNEGPGLCFLRALPGTASARVYDHGSNSALIEWLDGPTLGEMSRNGEDKKASALLVEVANAIHSQAPLSLSNLPLLSDWFEALFSCDFASNCPSRTRQNILRCRTMAKDLFRGQHDVRPLHGDLHHDNIKLGERGYCAFDAKGILGERTYELANAFRNPKGTPELVRDPQRIRYLLNVWGEAFRVDEHRLLRWATVKIALSIVWRGGGTVEADPEFDLLDVFMSLVDP